MRTLWTKLFPARTRTVRKAARPAPKPRLGIEALDDRVLPSATTALSGTTLTISANPADTLGESVLVLGSSGNLLLFGADQTSISSPVSRVVFKGGPKADSFENFSNVDSLVIGSAGGDTYVGGSGTNLLDRNGNSVSWSANSAGRDVAYGLGNGSPTTNDLSAPGAMMVSLSSDSTQLTIAGPSGIGFRLDAHWQDTATTTNGLTTHTFTPLGSVTLHTTSLLGNINLPNNNSGWISITTKPEPWSDPVGEYSSTALTGAGGFLPLNTTAATVGGVANSLATLGSQYGVNLSLPGLSWGLSLGGDLKSLNGFGSAPLNSAVPYFYYNNSPNFSGQIGGFSFQAGNSGIQVAFDPSDPFLYAALPVDSIAVAASVKGRIPFTPGISPPSSVLGLAAPPANIAGNVYLSGSIPLGDTPLSVTGSVVVGLPLNSLGQLEAGLSQLSVNQILMHQQSLNDVVTGMSFAPTVGINGDLYLGTDFFQGLVSANVKIGQAVAYFVPSLVTGTNDPGFLFYAQSVNPWADPHLPAVVSGTISKILPLGSYSLAGSVDSQGHWLIDLTAQAQGFAGITTSSLQVVAGDFSHSFTILGGISVFGLANASLGGTIDLSSGAVSAHESGNFSLEANLPVFGDVTFGSLSETLNINYTGGTNGTLSLGLDANGSVGVSGGNLSFSGHADLAVDLGSHNVTVADSHGEVDSNIRNPFTGNIDTTKLADVTIDSQHVSVVLLGKTLGSFTWSSLPGELVSDGPALAGAPARLQLVVPAGFAAPGPLHFSAALSPDQLAATYGAAGADPNVSFTFAAPGTYTVYGRILASDGRTTDYSTTVTVYGADQADTLYVAKLYHDLLGRDGSAAELAAYADALAHGANRDQVAAGFQASEEYREKVVQDAYRALLGRAADPVGLQGWVNFLAGGGTPEQMRAQIAASPEYMQLHGGANTGFVEGLYQSALGRAGTSDEVSAYTQELAGGVSRSQIAADFFSSLEYRLGQSQAFYQDLLGRDADPMGLWANAIALAQGTSDAQVMDHILASPEYAPTA